MYLRCTVLSHPKLLPLWLRSGWLCPRLRLTAEPQGRPNSWSFSSPCMRNISIRCHASYHNIVSLLRLSFIHSIRRLTHCSALERPKRTTALSPRSRQPAQPHQSKQHTALRPSDCSPVSAILRSWSTLS
jgi:hypothetical protein